MTDIAFVSNELYGITFDFLVKINPDTGSTTTIGSVGYSVNALAASNDGTLYAATGNGEFVTINKITGAGSLIGYLGSGLYSAGDLAFRADGTLFASVIVPGYSNTWLATVNSTNGTATLVGDTGFRNVLGISFKDGVLYGVTGGYGDVIALNTSTGAGTNIGRNNIDLWGLATSPTIGCNPGSDGVILYEHTYYMGQCYTFTSDHNDFNLIGFNDIASSIRFVGSYAGTRQATLFEHTYYGGNSIPFASDNPDFNPLNFNDIASSIRITTITPPSANFDAWPQSGNAPLIVSMHIVSTANISTCAWDYGDGQTGTSCAPYHSHTYTTGGTYTVRLTVTSPAGLTDSMTRNNYISVSGLTYPITGHVTYDSGNDASGVTITSSSGKSVVTDTNGNYTISENVGTYTITPTKSGYVFAPITRTVSVPPDATGQDFKGGNKNWTLMFYLDGDNNLDGDFAGIFNQLESVANNSSANIVVAWDRAGNGKDAYYKVKYDSNMNQLAAYTENVDVWTKTQLTMASSTTLGDFIQWARNNYPAQHYALIISDHGTGLNGIARDDTSGGAYLSIRGLGDALSTATANGINKIDVVFADACFMAMIEDAYQIRNYAAYYVASENEIFFPPAGTVGPYSNYVANITASTTPSAFAGDIVTQYANWATNYNGDSANNPLPYTISAVDLSQIANLVTAMSNLGTGLNAQMATVKSQVQAARTATQKFDSQANFVLNSSDEYLDVYDFATQIKSRITDATIQTQATAVQNAVLSYRIGESHRSGRYRGNFWNLNSSYGVSVFVPRNSRSFYSGPALDFAVGTIWDMQRRPTTRSTATTINWGPMLVEFVRSTNPTEPDDPNPPALVAPLNPSDQSIYFYLPFIIK